jgi:hypothetical protein
VPPKKVLPDNIPFGIGRDLIVDIPINPHGVINLLHLTISLASQSTSRTRTMRLALNAPHFSDSQQYPEKLPKSNLSLGMKWTHTKVGSRDWTYRNKNYARLGARLLKDDDSPDGQQTHCLHTSNQWHAQTGLDDTWRA